MCRAPSSCSVWAAGRSGPCRWLAGGSIADTLRAAIAADRAAGATPALLVGSAGTVNAGAIDPLEDLADVAAAEGLWFHVDGAYGAFGVLDPAIAGRYRGMERADSLTLDPHKWLGVPVDAGCALVRRPDDLREAFSIVPPYLRQDTGAEVGTFAEYGLEQTRPFRALKTWATIAARGRAGIVAQVVRANALARELAGLIEQEPSLELAAAPETSIVAFRARPSGCSPDRIEAVNRALPEAVQARGRTFVTGTIYEGRETMRACILHPGTTDNRPRDARGGGGRRGRRAGRGGPRLAIMGSVVDADASHTNADSGEPGTVVPRDPRGRRGVSAIGDRARSASSYLSAVLARIGSSRRPPATIASDTRWFEMSNEMLVEASLDGYFVRLSDQWEQTLGWTREELMSRPFKEFIHPDDLEATMVRALRWTSTPGEVVDFENRYRAKDGS